MGVVAIGAVNPSPTKRPSRLLIVLPSWVGDTVMATPTLRALRRALPGAFLGGLARQGLDDLLHGSGFLDEVHTDRATGMMGPKRVASRLRVVRYDTALLLTNSFSTALTTRLAGIPRRIGYDRDGRGLLLTEKLHPSRRKDVEPYRRSTTAPNEWAPIAACEYYFALAKHMARSWGEELDPMGPMELHSVEPEREAASAVLKHLGIDAGERLVLLNPGGNDLAKRWPAERFAAVGAMLIDQRDVHVLVSGSPGEAELTARITELIARPGRAHDLAAAFGAMTGTFAQAPVGALGILKAIIERCALMLTNDTGPRHIAAALGVPVVSLFGPTDCRWTTIPFERERILVADPTLPEEEVANDHAERCAITRIDEESVKEAAISLLAARPG